MARNENTCILMNAINECFIHTKSIEYNRVVYNRIWNRTESKE